MMRSEVFLRASRMFFARCWFSLGLLVVLAAAVSVAVAADDEAATAAKPAKKPRVTIGRIEYVRVRDADMVFKARIDTGAGISSLDANILEYKKSPKGEEMVVFELADAEGRTVTLERPVHDWANIKVMGTDTKNRRPVVKLHVCIGGKRLYGRVNLNDRSSFLYPMLVGRNLLNTGKFLVDPSRRYLKEPGCEKKPKDD